MLPEAVARVKIWCLWMKSVMRFSGRDGTGDLSIEFWMEECFEPQCAQQGTIGFRVLGL